MTDLSILQRFHETLRAMARDDIDAVQQLRASCPRVPELLPDSDYRDLVDGTEKWAMVVAIDLGPVLARYELLTDLAPVLHRMARETSPTHRGRERATLDKDVIAHVQTQLMAQIHAFWDALETVCAALLETDVRTVLAAEYPPLLDQLQRHQPQWAAIARDEAQYQVHIKTLTALWLTFCGPVPSATAPH